MTGPEAFEVLAETIRVAGPEELPALVGRLVELEERARLRLRVELNGNSGRQEAEPEMLTPEEAASIVKVPVKRIYEWARGKKWASRPTKRCLRIEETGFRLWLTTGT
jgi:hypothetical protein